MSPCSARSATSRSNSTVSGSWQGSLSSSVGHDQFDLNRNDVASLLDKSRTLESLAFDMHGFCATMARADTESDFRPNGSGVAVRVSTVGLRYCPFSSLLTADRSIPLVGHVGQAEPLRFPMLFEPCQHRQQVQVLTMGNDFGGIPDAKSSCKPGRSD